MFPLVSQVAEARRARELFHEVAAAGGHDLAEVEVGVMVEVPSAALAARRLAAEMDFLSVGTNDLLQYLYAADRLLASVASLADACAPEFLALVGDIVEAGHAEGCWVGVCGEAASATAIAFVGLGIDELSMTRVAIPEVKATDPTRRHPRPGPECRPSGDAGLGGRRCAERARAGAAGPPVVIDPSGTGDDAAVFQRAT